ncbi:unnamed protein product [Rotaria magnacalcarata]
MVKSKKFLGKVNRTEVAIDFLPNEPVLIANLVEDQQFDITNDSADVEEMSHRLVCLTKAMLNKIDDLIKATSFRFDKQFRLEFRPASFYKTGDEASNNKHWELRMMLDPVAWFDWKWSDASPSYDAQRELLAVARAYVDKYYNIVPEEYLNPPKQMPLPSKHSEARPTLSNEHYYSTRPQLKCTGKMHGGKNCEHHIIHERIVMEWRLCLENNCIPKSASFIFTNKKENVRELLLHPTPPWHIVNRELVCLPIFWSTAIYTCRLLRNELMGKKLLNDVKWPVDCIAINFAKWESASFNEKYAIDCHAHAHFLLTLDFIDQCDDGFFSPLKGRQDATPNYLKENVKLLESERLLSYEMRALQQDMRSCLTKIKDIQTNESHRDEKIDKILALLEQKGKNEDDNRDTNTYKSSIISRYSSSQTNINSSYFNRYSNMTYSYVTHTHESP